MARATITGFDTVFSMLAQLGQAGEAIEKEAIYEGAKIMADALKEEIRAMPAVPESENLKAYKTGGKSRLSIKQKEGLLNAMGIAPISADGDILNTKVGFDGYNSIKTKKYPNGQPNQLIARVVESGSSYMDKRPFIRKTLNKYRAEVQEKMRETAIRGIDRITRR